MSHPSFQIYRARAAKGRTPVLANNDPNLPSDFAQTIVQLFGTHGQVKVEPNSFLSSNYTSGSSHPPQFTNTTPIIDNSRLAQLFEYLEFFMRSSATKVYKKTSVYFMYFYLFVIYYFITCRFNLFSNYVF